MPAQWGPTKIGAMQYNGLSIKEAMMNGQIVYRSLPVVQITGTSGYQSRDQFRAACDAHGVDYTTMTEIPFDLDISQATSLERVFHNCAALRSIKKLDTGHIDSFSFALWNCSSLTDDSVLFSGRKVGATTGSMTNGTSLSRLPFEAVRYATVPRTQLSNNVWTTIGTDTIGPEDGSAVRSIIWTASWGNNTGTKGSRIVKNGTVIASTPLASTSLTESAIETQVSPGDVIQYQALANSTTASARVLWERSVRGIYVR